MNKFRSGKWITRGGSALKIIVEGNRFSGTYSTAHGRPSPDELFYASGLINGDLVGFTVAFRHSVKDYATLTTWCGRCEMLQKSYEREDKYECLRAVWVYAKMFADRANTEPVDSSSVFHIGTTADFFWEGELSEEDENLIKKIDQASEKLT